MHASIQAIAIISGYIALLIHPVMAVPIVLVYVAARRFCTFNAVMTLSVALAGITATRNVFETKAPDDLVTYVEFSKLFPQLTWVDFFIDARFEPVFYLPYYFFGPFEPLPLLFMNSFIACLLLMISVCVLSKKFSTNLTVTMALTIGFFPFEIVSNTPRQVAAVGFMFAALGSKWRVLSLLIHKAALLPYLLTFTSSKRFFLTLLLASFLLLQTSFGRELFLGRLSYFFIQDAAFSPLLVVMLLSSLFTYFFEKDNKIFWFFVTSYVGICLILTQFGPLGVRLSFLIYPIFIVQMALIIKFFCRRLKIGNGFNIAAVASLFFLFIFRLTGSGPHEPFTGIDMAESFFWGI